MLTQQAGKMGGLEAAKRMSQAQRSARARKASNARWGNSKQRRKARRAVKP